MRITFILSLTCFLGLFVFVLINTGDADFTLFDTNVDSVQENALPPFDKAATIVDTE